MPINYKEPEAEEKLDDNAAAEEATPFNDIVDLENPYPWNDDDLENPYPWEDGAAAGEIILVEEEQEKKQREESGAVPTVLNNWYWKNKKWISGTVTNHPRMDQGAQVSLTMAKSDRQKHLKPGLTIHSTCGRPYLLGASKPSTKEKEDKQQEELVLIVVQTYVSTRRPRESCPWANCESK